MSIKEKLTKEEAVRRHRELWNKIAELCTGEFRAYEIKYVALEVLGMTILSNFQIACVGRANMRPIMQYTFIELTKVHAASAP